MGGTGSSLCRDLEAASQACSVQRRSPTRVLGLHAHLSACTGAFHTDSKAPLGEQTCEVQACAPWYVPVSLCRSVAYTVSSGFAGTWTQTDAGRQETLFLGNNWQQKEEAS